MLELVIPGGQPSRIPSAVMLDVSHSRIRRRNDVAKTFELKPESVSMCKTLTDGFAKDGDDEYMKSTAKQYGEKPPVHFASPMSLDATLERIQPPMLGLELAPHVTADSWHVVVTSQSFSWGSAAGQQSLWSNIILNAHVRTSQRLHQRLAIPLTMPFTKHHRLRLTLS